MKVNNGPPLRGSVGVDGEEENGVYRGRWGGVSVSQGLSVSCCWDEVEVRVCESVCTQAGC